MGELLRLPLSPARPTGRAPSDVAPRSALGHLELGLGEELTGSNAAQLADVRVLVIDDQPAHADELAQALRARGALVFVAGPRSRELSRARALDPQVAFVRAGLEDSPSALALSRCARLRWTAVLTTPWERIWPDERAAPGVEPMLAEIVLHLAAERAMRGALATAESFRTKLFGLGPARLLRVVAEAGHSTRIKAVEGELSVEVDVAPGLVVGARARARGQALEGSAALGVWLGMREPRVDIKPQDRPGGGRILAPVEVALADGPPGVEPVARSAQSVAVKPQPSAPRAHNSAELEVLHGWLEEGLLPEDAELLRGIWPGPASPPDHVVREAMDALLSSGLARRVYVGGQAHLAPSRTRPAEHPVALPSEPVRGGAATAEAERAFQARVLHDAAHERAVLWRVAIVVESLVGVALLRELVLSLWLG